MSKQLLESTITLLSRTPGVDMKTPGVTNLYTVPIVPVAFSCIVFAAVVRNNTASLAGGTDYNVGVGANNFGAVDLSGLVNPDSFFSMDFLEAGLAVFVAGQVIQFEVVTGATAAGSATVDLFGYVF